MDKMLNALQAYGADIDGAMGRFIDDADLYKACFAAFLCDEAFPKLEEALAAKDYTAAFECAHTLKGITGNMGLTPLYQVICRMVEALRREEYTALQEDYGEIAEHLRKLKALEK